MELHDDDQPVGRVLTRREVLALLGGGSAAVLLGMNLPRLSAAQTTPTPSATPLPTCVARPELAEGPYFVETALNRFDIRIDPNDNSVKPGTPLRLVYRVSDVTGGNCVPLKGAQVDVWHCDAQGVYSGVQDPSFDTTSALWLRGYQVTDAEGTAEFLTIFPGWYPGRAVHIHFKIRTEPAAERGYEFVSQLFFDPTDIETIYTEEPYAERGLPNRPNEQDGIYQASEGLLTLRLAPMTNEELAELELESGYSAIFDIGLDLSA